jgi:hypothetical protein
LNYDVFRDQLLFHKDVKGSAFVSQGCLWITFCFTRMFRGQLLFHYVVYLMYIML